MRAFAPALVALMLLAGCSDEPGTPAAVQSTATPATSTQQQAREAGAALQDAGREVGEAASSAAGDVRDAAAPAVARAKEAGAEALDATRNGLNDFAKGAACQTARGANDAAGIAANC
ncbi:hypothetical protein [Aureimonas pseudogalii]|uniref:Lipoprotein n=1 Tax=Aureimonas pseudogalii TaxID=1744844 RepID=A0A7W6E923_9HYPH|nr:hypothetical protein [Aureimonas pseudogalii]MBB3996996.1 hypothetical protein [Aureimonas pseudogalii]